MSNLNQLYRRYTGILTDVESAIAAAKTEQEKRDLYNKLVWRIPGGLVRNNYKDLLDELAARLIGSEPSAPEAQSTVIVEEITDETPLVEEITDETPAEEPVVDETPAEAPAEEFPVDEAASVVEEENKDEDLQDLLGE